MKVGQIKLKTPEQLIGEIEWALKDRWLDSETHYEFKSELYRAKNDVRRLDTLLYNIRREASERRQKWGAGA